ncbi:MAG: HigA family addiction module antidote protein [Desulfobacteraceae bacterium]|nr:HigA family addiction module antidote protein [Desulfobacteraceae bacterium]
MKLRKRPPVHPGGILKRNYIDQSVITITELSDILGISEKTALKILNECASVTPDIALRLSRAFNTSPELWLNLQQNYDLWHTFHDSMILKNIQAVAERL